MQLLVDIKSNVIAEKIIRILEVFKNDGVEIKTLDSSKKRQKDTQEYDVDYEKSYQYKLDRADFVEMKEGL